MELTKKSIKNTILCDRIIACKDGSYKFRSGYFYKHGQTAQKFSDKIIKQIEDNFKNVFINIIDVSDNWNPWPKDSYFETHLRIENKN